MATEPAAYPGWCTSSAMRDCGFDCRTVTLALCWRDRAIPRRNSSSSSSDETRSIMLVGEASVGMGGTSARDIAIACLSSSSSSEDTMAILPCVWGELGERCALRGTIASREFALSRPHVRLLVAWHTRIRSSIFMSVRSSVPYANCLYGTNTRSSTHRDV